MSFRILVVDDEEDLSSLLRDYLAGSGHDVDVAADLACARALATASRYDVVLSDLSLRGSKGAEGFELLSFLRHRHPETRCILLTASESSDIAREARERGASVVLRKPHPLPSLLAVIERLIRERD